MSEHVTGVGWRSLGDLHPTPPTLFKNLLFLEGYDFSCNIYVLLGEYLTVIDPANDYTAFMQLFNLGHRPADIGKVVLTHGHFDHVMGLVELLRGYPSVYQGGLFEVVAHQAMPAELEESARQLGCRVTKVQGGELLELGGQEFEVVHTPGHTEDGICLYHAGSGTVFTGDTVLPHAMAAPDPGAGGRLEDYLAGLKSLLSREIRNVLPGHGPPVVSTGRDVVVETYEGVVKKIAGDNTSWLGAALKFLQIGYLEETVYCCDKWLTDNPADFRGLELKGLSLNDLGRFAEAEEVFNQLLARQGDRLSALLGKGYALMGQEQYEESLRYFDSALAIKPDLQEARVYKGLALYLSGKYEEAMDIEAFRMEFIGKIQEELRKKTEPASQSK